MDSKNEMTRKQFLVLTFSLVGTTAAMGSCDDDNNNTTGTAGTSGGTAGTSGGTAGTTGGGGTTGTGGGGGTNGAACTDPLPQSQVADSSGHTHSVTIAASTLNATTAQTFPTSSAGAPAHTHMVMLEPAQLATLKGGSTVTVTSTPANQHTHMYMVSCT